MLSRMEGDDWCAECGYTILVFLSWGGIRSETWEAVGLQLYLRPRVLGEKFDLTHLGCLEIPHNPEVMNFSSCFLASLAFLQAAFSAPSARHSAFVRLFEASFKQNSRGDGRVSCPCDAVTCEWNIPLSARISSPNPPAQIPMPNKSLRPRAGWAARGMALTRIAGRETTVIHVAWPNLGVN